MRHPQATTLPSSLSARLCQAAAIARTPLVAEAGTLHCPRLSSPPQPQATTLPSRLSARLWPPPAEIAVTPLCAAPGTAHCPLSRPPPQPQAITLPGGPAAAAGSAAARKPATSAARTLARTKGKCHPRAAGTRLQRSPAAVEVHREPAGVEGVDDVRPVVAVQVAEHEGRRDADGRVVARRLEVAVPAPQAHAEHPEAGADEVVRSVAVQVADCEEVAGRAPALGDEGAVAAVEQHRRLDVAARDGDIRLPVAVQVADREGVRRAPDGVAPPRRKGAAASVEEDGHSAGVGVRRDDVRAPVAVHVA